MYNIQCIAEKRLCPPRLKARLKRSHGVKRAIIRLNFYEVVFDENIDGKKD